MGKVFLRVASRIKDSPKSDWFVFCSSFLKGELDWSDCSDAALCSAEHIDKVGSTAFSFDFSTDIPCYIFFPHCSWWVPCCFRITVIHVFDVGEANRGEWLSFLYWR